MDEKGIKATEGDKLGADEITVAPAHPLESHHLPAVEKAHIAKDLELEGSQDNADDLDARADAMPLEQMHEIIEQLYAGHKNDQNFPRGILDTMELFLSNPTILENPDKHPEVIRELKLEALLATENSPYLEVRANVDATDDPTMPVLTFRVLFIGTIFSAAGVFIDSLFSFRQPAVYVATNVGQLLAYPAGKAMEYLPTRKFRLFGREFSLNPGKFNKKEHMLITIMANVSFSAPYTTYIVPVQALPMFFNQPWARNFAYQIINTIGTNFVGYGIAGLTRRFLVWPAVAIWPGTLSVVALNKAFHTETNEPVRGPFGTWRISRQRFFLYSFLAMFVWFWLPGYLFTGLSAFSWMTWIAPNNSVLDTVTGFYGGMGLNPWPTFDWNNLTVWLVPLTIPTFAIMNMFVGILTGAVMTLIVYYKNAWNTGYLPINGNDSYDNTGGSYNVSRILGPNNEFVNDQYQAYSQPWMSAGYIVSYLWYFALYSATFTYVILFHWRDIIKAYRSFRTQVRKTFRRGNHDEPDLFAEDVHYRLMQRYPDVPEWKYLCVLLVSMIFGMVGVGVFPTNTSPAVLVFGIIMPLIAIIPCGLIQALTGIPVPLNVLAEFIGGSIVEGNANALMYFKTYGYISVYQALAFSNDLKLAHYTKIPPRYTFYMQLWATLIYCFVSSAILNFAMDFKNVCTPEADFNFLCPNQRTFYSAAVFWGTISPNRLFGPGARYNWMLVGFPLGVLLVLGYWLLRRRFPRSEFLRQIHPVMLTAGPSTWGSPYNMSYYLGNVYVVLFSFQYIRKKYPAFWSKFNYVVAAAFPAGIAIATIVIFFGLAIPNGGYNVKWWGNEVTGLGCEGKGGCPYLVVENGGYFGNAPGSGTFV